MKRIVSLLIAVMLIMACATVALAEEVAPVADTKTTWSYDAATQTLTIEYASEKNIEIYLDSLDEQPVGGEVSVVGDIEAGSTHTIYVVENGVLIETLENVVIEEPVVHGDPEYTIEFDPETLEGKIVKTDENNLDLSPAYIRFAGSYNNKSDEQLKIGVRTYADVNADGTFYIPVDLDLKYDNEWNLYVLQVVDAKPAKKADIPDTDTKNGTYKTYGVALVWSK